MAAPNMDGSGPRSELQELQIKAQQATDEVRESLETRLGKIVSKSLIPSAPDRPTLK